MGLFLIQGEGMVPLGELAHRHGASVPEGIKPLPGLRGVEAQELVQLYQPSDEIRALAIAEGLGQLVAGSVEASYLFLPHRITLLPMLGLPTAVSA